MVPLQVPFGGCSTTMFFLFYTVSVLYSISLPIGRTTHHTYVVLTKGLDSPVEF